MALAIAALLAFGSTSAAFAADEATETAPAATSTEVAVPENTVVDEAPPAVEEEVPAAVEESPATPVSDETSSDSATDAPAELVTPPVQETPSAEPVQQPTPSTEKPAEVVANAPPQEVTPAPVKDATASVTVTPATCEAPASLAYGETNHATLSGTPNGTVGPADYTVTATADEGHLNADGLASWTVASGTLSGVLETQSTDPYGECYVPPTEEQPTLESATVLPWCSADKGGVDIALSVLGEGDFSVHMAYTYIKTGVSTDVTLEEHPIEGGKSYTESLSGLAPGDYQFAVTINYEVVRTIDVTVPDCATPSEPVLKGATITSACYADESGVNVTLDVEATGNVMVNMTATNKATGVTSEPLLENFWWENGGHLETRLLMAPGDYTFTITIDDKVVRTIDVTVAKCGDTEVPLVAKVWYESIPATCEAPSSVKFFWENAIPMHEPDLSVGTHTLEFDAIQGAWFPGDMATYAVTYTIDPKLASQSTDPNGKCYVAPPTEEPEKPTTPPTKPSEPVTPPTNPPAKPSEPVKPPKSGNTETLATTGSEMPSTLAGMGLLALIGGALLLGRRFKRS